MGCPVIRPPPRREGESWEAYRVRCEPWRQLTLRNIAQSRRDLARGFRLFIGVLFVLALCVVLIVAKECAG